MQFQPQNMFRHFIYNQKLSSHKIAGPQSQGLLSDFSKNVTCYYLLGGRVGAAVVPVPLTNAARVRFPVGSESYVNLVLDPYLPAQVFSEHFGFLLHLKSYLLSIFLSKFISGGVP